VGDQEKKEDHDDGGLNITSSQESRFCPTLPGEAQKSNERKRDACTCWLLKVMFSSLLDTPES